MTSRLISAVVTLCVISVVPLGVTRASPPPPQNGHWVASWSTALVERPSQSPPASVPSAGERAPAPPRFNNQTLRQTIRVSVGGDQVRVVLSNFFGTTPLKIGAAHIGLVERESAIVASSGRRLTFSGAAATSIPPGASMTSDPTDFALPALADLAVDVYLPDDTAAAASPLTAHMNALQTNYVSTSGNHAGTTILPVASTTASWFFLARIEVHAPANVGAVVALGDSITDGARSTPDSNNRWPDQLARVLTARGVQMGVLNMGIAGNRVLDDGNGVSALARLERDVLSQPGVTHVIFLQGINDIGRGASAEALIAAHTAIIERAHARGLKIVGGTLSPFEDTTFEGFYTPLHEEARQALNTWIRTSHAYDAVVDFDALLRDPSRPTRLDRRYAASDFIHPNDLGYRAMGDAIEVAWLQPVNPAVLLR